MLSSIRTYLTFYSIVLFRLMQCVSYYRHNLSCILLQRFLRCFGIVGVALRWFSAYMVCSAYIICHFVGSLFIVI